MVEQERRIGGHCLAYEGQRLVHQHLLQLSQLDGLLHHLLILHEEGVKEGLHPEGPLPPGGGGYGEVLNEQPSCSKGEKHCGKPSLSAEQPTEGDEREEDGGKYWKLLNQPLHLEEGLAPLKAVHQGKGKTIEVLEAMAKRTMEMVTPSVPMQPKMPFSNHSCTVVLLPDRQVVVLVKFVMMSRDDDDLPDNYDGGANPYAW